MKTAEDIIKINASDVVSVSPRATIHDALEIMTACKIGAILVIENKRIVGIWTERDLMRNVLSEGFDLQSAQIEDYMIQPVQFAAHDDSIYDLMDKFLGLRFRHLPIEKNGEFIGFLSIGDVLKACLHEKTQEFEQLNGIVNWNYYEEWKWDFPAEKRELARN